MIADAADSGAKLLAYWTNESPQFARHDGAVTPSCRRIALRTRSSAELCRLHGCKVLIVTGYPEAVISEIRLDYCGVLQKPFSDQRLLDAVKNCLPGEAAFVPSPRDPSGGDVVSE